MGAHVGKVVLVTVPPEHNNEQDQAPGLITAVHDNGMVQVVVFYRGGVVYRDGVIWCENREKVDELQRYHYQDLPGHGSERGADGKQRHVPGHNPTAGRPWVQADVAHWVRAAWPVDEHDAQADKDARDEPEREPAPAVTFRPHE
jgi:hypothetical protein